MQANTFSVCSSCGGGSTVQRSEKLSSVNRSPTRSHYLLSAACKMAKRESSVKTLSKIKCLAEFGCVVAQMIISAKL